MQTVIVDQSSAALDRSLECFEELYREEYPRMVRLAYALVSDPGDADDREPTIAT